MEHHEMPNPIYLIRYGSTLPLPTQHRLHAGPISLILEDGGLKKIKVGEEELVRRIYSAVRNEAWETVLPHFNHCSIDQREDSFFVLFEAEHKNQAVDFIWEGRIVGSSDGTVQFSMEGIARTTFLKNRIGFCILHPMEMAGLPVEVITSSGSMESSYPKFISPHQPFKDILGLRQKLQHNLEMELRFEGDIFEMEDQRNWTDASFKTYCTPLDIPYPVVIQEGEKVKQTVTLHVSSHVDNLELNTDSLSTLESIQIVNKAVVSLPEIGLIYGSNTAILTDEEGEYTKALRLSHLRIEINCLRFNWLSNLSQAAAEANMLGIKVEIEAIVGDKGEGLPELIKHLRDKQIIPERLYLYTHASKVTSRELLIQAQQYLDELGLQLHLGGGSRLYFTELNRTPMPFDLMESATYPLNPQVHAFDNESMVETLAAQAATLHSARALLGDMPVSLGPITLKSRFNKKDEQADCEHHAGPFPKKTDSRQMSLFGAGWTIGSIRNLAIAGANALTYYEITGNNGIMHPHFGLYPVYHIFAEIGEMKQALQDAKMSDTENTEQVIELLEVRLRDPLKLEVLALRKALSIKFMIANLRNENQNIQIDIPRCKIIQIRILDETSAIQAMTDRAHFRARNDGVPRESANKLELELLPYAICILDGKLLEA